MFNATVFERITTRPTIALFIAAIIIVAMAAGLKQLVKDTSIEAFVPTGHPSLAANNEVRETFGLTDAIAVAVVAPQDTVFTSANLNHIAQVTNFLQGLDNLRKDRVVSLATESSIQGVEGAVEVTEYLDMDDAPLAADQVARVRAQWQAMPPHQGTLVSNDESAAVIMGEIIDITDAQDTYQQVRTYINTLPTNGVEFHVAGPGAVSGYFSAYIEQDARKLLPIGFGLVLLFVFLAFRRASALTGPLIIILSTVTGTLGVMAWCNVPYYAITNALAVVLVAIAVADAIHVLSAYYEARAANPHHSSREHAVTAMQSIAKPVVLTTLTTMVGFVGIGLVSVMPPIVAFAWFACFGSALAGLLTLLVLPNLLAVLPPAQSNLFSGDKSSPLADALTQCAKLGARRPVRMICIFVVLANLAGIGAGQIQIDRSQIDNFAADEPIRVADELINQKFAGTVFLNLVVSAEQDDALLETKHMQAIADLQQFIEQQPHVNKTVSIADYLSLLDAAIETRPISNDRSLPTAEDAIAQYLLIYEASGSPTDFEEEIDPYYSTALIRIFLDAPRFSDNKQTVENIQQYLDENFSTGELSATLAGDVNLTYHWMQQLIDTHFTGIAVSLALVLGIACLMFRSVLFGCIAVVSVAFTVLAIYGVMGFAGVNLEPPTSMFAAIAIGVGVDFAIHLVARLREVQTNSEHSFDAVLTMALPSTARACFFNAAALTVGFSVLTISDLPTLQRFGGLISLAALASFAASLLLIPALFGLVSRLQHRRPTPTLRKPANPTAAAVVVLIFAAGFSSDPALAAAATPLSGTEVAERIAARPAGTASTRQLKMSLTDRRGRSRERLAVVHKSSTEQDQRTRITYLEPKAVRNVGFLSHDFHQLNKNDERWLYMPATRKVRRIPASDRGDYFLGTDFTFADMQSELKFELADYQFTNAGLNSDGLIQLIGTPVSKSVAKEIGYGGFTALVDPNTWIPMQIDFSDRDGSPLKTVLVGKVENISDIWTAQSISTQNHQTGHKTEFHFSNTQYHDTLAAKLFASASLSRGAPKP